MLSEHALPAPKLSRTPPRNSWLVSRSWSQIASSRLDSLSSSSDRPSKINVWFQTGLQLCFTTAVFCLSCFERFGNRYLPTANTQQQICQPITQKKTRSNHYLN